MRASLASPSETQARFLQHSPTGRSTRGFTLIEAMVAVVIAGILLTVAVPGFATFLVNHRVAVATNDMVHAIAATRSEAMRRGKRVYLAPTGALWRDGWAIFVDRNDNRRFDPPMATNGDELIELHGALPPSVTLVNPANPGRQSFTDVGSPQRTYLLFDGSGYPRQRNGGFSVGSMTITDRVGPAQATRTICLAVYGRVRVLADRASCS